MHDRLDEAQEALRRYLGKDLEFDDQVVLLELASIQESFRIEQQSAITFKEVILGRDRSRHLGRLFLGCGGQFMQQFGGINALNYYFPIILTESLGLSELLARILTGCNATSYMISSGFCFWMIERFGRRSLMLSGLGLQGLAYIMVAISVALLATAPNQVYFVTYCINLVLIYRSGVPLPSHSFSSTMLRSGVLGVWFHGFIKPKSTLSR